MNRLQFSKALGELVIIVVGILIALFAESAWNDYQDRAEGRKYLARLSAETKSNLELLTADKLWAQQSCYSAEAGLSLLRDTDGKNDPAAFLRFAASASLYENPRYQRVTYDDLVGTGGLSLIDDAQLREKIVAAYTEFFETLNAWRPPKDSPLRTAVLRSLPGEFIHRVAAECLSDTDMNHWTDTLRLCSTTPASGSAEAMLSKLKSRPDLEGYLSERAWQTCEFEQDISLGSAPLVELAAMLGATLQQ